MKENVRINEYIRAKELRVILEDGTALGVLGRDEALAAARNRELDLIEISPNAIPPVAKITDYGRFQYQAKKKDRLAKSKIHRVETKSLQVKIGTGEHDLALKAKKASEFLREGHRVKIELYLRGRAKYLDKKFLEERLARVLNLITEEFRVADGPKQGPKGLLVTIERAGKKKEENVSTPQNE